MEILVSCRKTYKVTFKCPECEGIEIEEKYHPECRSYANIKIYQQYGFKRELPHKNITCEKIYKRLLKKRDD